MLHYFKLFHIIKRSNISDWRTLISKSWRRSCTIIPRGTMELIGKEGQSILSSLGKSNQTN